MDSARDMVDVREMVELKKPRLTGPTSAIQGVYDGPAWYYLLAIPYLLSEGDPYSEILMEIVLWTIGGYFLLKLLSRFGKISMIAGGTLWVSSNYMVLLNMYSFNPNPVALLAPLFFYLLVSFLETKKQIFYILAWFMAGIYFNFEMNAGVFPPMIILITQFLNDRKSLFSKVSLYGYFAFFATLLPQILFDLRHEFIMSQSLIKFIQTSSGSIEIGNKITNLWQSFYNVFNATFFNFPILSALIITLTLYLVINYFKEVKNNWVIVISLLFIFVPFISYIILPVTVNSWHLGLEVVAAIFLASLLLKYIPKGISLALLAVILYWGSFNIFHFFQNEYGKRSLDPSMYVNEIAAIDYVYQKAGGKNFKVYTHIPSVYDFPYQYLFYWHGKKTYGYVPFEYSYLPNKPEYIPSQSHFQDSSNKSMSNLVFLIKETQNPKLLDLWINNFKDYPFIHEEKVGPLSIETRLDTNNLSFFEESTDKN